MKFGLLPDDQLDIAKLQLPPEPAQNAVILAGLEPRTGPVQVYIGATGWSHKEWVDYVYPPGAKTTDYLHHYTRQFNTIELNTTHYRIPDAATIQRWYDTAPADFRYCPKIPQSISHSASLGRGETALQQFCTAVAGLREKLGCCFVQLPPHFDLRRKATLEDFLQRFPADIPLAVELRHESWFATPEAVEEYLELLRRYNRTAVIADVAARRDVVHMALTTGETMIRFVGYGLHATDYQRADAWILQLQQWVEAGLHTIWLLPHQPGNLRTPEMAAYLTERIHATFPAALRGPDMSRSWSGSQISLF